MKYHGWIIRVSSAGYNDQFYCEFIENGNRKRTVNMHSPASAIEFFDKRAGQPVKLIDTPLGAYRVYTDVPCPDTNLPIIRAHILNEPTEGIIRFIFDDRDLPIPPGDYLLKLTAK